MRKLILAVTTTIAVLAPALMLAAGAGATTGSESFSLIDTSTADKPFFSVIATGAFVAGGTATRPSKGVLKLRFPDGTITTARAMPTSGMLLHPKQPLSHEPTKLQALSVNVA